MSKTLELPAETGYKLMTIDASEALDLVRGAVESGVTSFDFDRVKVPAGGGVTWEIPSLAGEPDSEKTLSGVIVGIAQKKAYWMQSLDESGGGSPPNCRSEDGILGAGNPGGPCKACPFNQFGSSSKGDGKACRDMLHILLIRRGSMLPLLLAVPPTSIRPIRQFMLRASGQGIPFWAMEMSFSLEKDKASGGQTYSRIVPALSRALSAEETARFRMMKAELEPLLSAVPVERDEE